MVSKDTVLLALEGNKEVRRLHNNEYINTYTKHNGNPIIQKTKIKSSHYADDYYELELINGVTVKGLFSVMMEDGTFKKVQELEKGDILTPCVMNGKDDDSDLALPKKVLKVTHIKECIELYDFTTKEFAVDAGIIIS